jgi:hypothetical protein
VLKFNRRLMQTILRDPLSSAKIVNGMVFSLDESPERYKDFDKGDCEEARHRSTGFDQGAA